METPRLLCDSNLCRLCGEENKNSTSLFPADEYEQDLSQLVNKYLPLKVERDGKFPIAICPGCNIQLEATKQFLDLIIEGQNKLRDLFRIQQETLRRQEKQRQQLESALKNVNPNSSVETYAIQADETGEKFIIQIFSEGPLFPPDHELSLKVEGLEKPKRKRGRPPKPPPPTEEELKVLHEEELRSKSEQEEDDNEIDADGRRKRKIKVPSRFQEAVQGKELDRIFKEEGVIDEDSLSENETHLETIITPTKPSDEVIGHLQSKEGEDLGELVIVNKNTNRLRIKAKEDIPSVKKKKYECEICSREFLHYGRYEVHRSFHKGIKYKCNENECSVEDQKKVTIEEHQKETGHNGISIIENLDNYGQVQLPQVTTSSENLNCDTPEETETSNGEVPEHDSLKTSRQLDADNKFSCEICSKTFSCKQNYEVHLKAVHENQRPYQCDKCDKSFPYINSLKCHMIQHSDKSEKLYACGICRKVFNHPSSLVYHREAEHNNGRRFVCNKCNKSFKHKQLLQRHQLVHSDERPHECKLCKASFKTRANLLNHMPIHTGEKKYFCMQCGQAFAHKTSLTLHIRWHSGQKPYECDVCMKTFSQKGNLAEHKRIHTGEKPYCCDHCGRKFTTSSQFKLHVKRHTGERPWRCEYCSKTFLHKDTWKCHTRRHRNERPYQCQQCFRGFTEQWALKKHERLHTGEKPYVCDVCHKGFADCSNLTKHKKIHGNIKINRRSTKPKNIKLAVASGEGDNQVIYLTYQDSNSNDSQLQTLVHFMDPIDNATAATASAMTNENEPESLNEDAFLTSTTLPESFTHFQTLQQVVDEDGSVLSLTTVDGQPIKVLTTLEEGNQSIQGLMPNGTLIPISLPLPDSKTIITDITAAPSITNLGEKSNEEDLHNENMGKDQVATANVSTANGQILDSGGLQLLNQTDAKLDSSIQFLTEDGQNICLINYI